MTLLSRSEGLLVGEAMASEEPPQAARADRHAAPSQGVAQFVQEEFQARLRDLKEQVGVRLDPA